MISDTSSQEEQQQDPSSSSSSTNRPNNTLKNRIMMAMETTTTSNDNDDDVKEVHISSVLAAASALASLGNQGSTPPSPSTLVDLASGLESEEHAVKSFPQKLHEILSTPEYTDIITWLPNGRGFIILQKRQFASEIMPACFKHGKFTSFTRKLNRWNFTRVTRGSESGAYYHKYFRRDEPDLCLKMHCHSKPPSKDNNMGSSSSSSKQRHTHGGSSSPMASPGVSSAMTRLKLLESSPRKQKQSESSSLFSTSNPEIYAPDLTPIPEVGRSNPPSSLSMSDSKIYAPDLTRRTENGTTSSFPSATSRQHTDRRTFQMQAHQAMLERNRAMLELKHGMLLKTNRLMLNGSTNNHHRSNDLSNKLRQQQQMMTNGNNFFSQQRESNNSSSQHHSQGRPSSFASYNSRQHPLVMHEAMNALRRKQGANDSSDPLAMPTLRRQQNMPTDKKAASNSNDPLAMPTLQRQQNMPYAATDKAYLDWLRSKNPDPSGERFVSALEAALGTPEHTRAMIREVMKARMAEYEKRRAADTEDDGERKPAAAAVKTAATMDRKQVANVYGKTNKPSKEDYPKAVRRASAA